MAQPAKQVVKKPAKINVRGEADSKPPVVVVKKKLPAKVEDIVVAEKVKNKVKFPDEKPAAKAPAVISAIDAARAALMPIYSQQLDKMEKKFNFVSSELSIPDRLTTGTLIGDLLTGGGMVAGTMIQISGFEKGGKTTQCMEMVGSSLTNAVPVVNYFDAENALNDPKYAEAVIKHKIKDVFYGERKRARLYQESVLEDFYNSSKALMRSLPDKRWRVDRGAWFFVFEADKIGRAKMALFGYTNYDTELYKETGQLWCQTEIPGLQGIIFCDSYPALVTVDVEESDDQKRGMALSARGFSENIRKVKGVLKRKGFVVVGINQIRLKPGVNMGNPEYEPGGEALKFNSDVRLQNRPRTVPQGWGLGVSSQGKPTTQYGSEPSVQGKGTDNYAYVYIQNTKNKVGTPYLGSWARIWFKDYKGKAHGYDPVFDAYMYFKATGRLEGGIKKFTLTGIKAVAGVKFSFEMFKRTILAEVLKDDSLATDWSGGLKSMPKLRALAFKELKDGSAFTMVTGSTSPSEDGDLEAELDGE